MIEVELRGLLDKKSYNRLMIFFADKADSFINDNKEVTYYEYNDGILKVVNEESSGRAKISLKIGDEFSGLGMDEHDVYLGSRSEVDKCKLILDRLDHKVKSVVYQQRNNCVYNGVEFAIKHTKDWGYHFEAEIVVDNQDDVKKARQKIIDVCSELNIVLMTADELRNFISKLQSK